MKKLFTFLLCICLTVSAFSQGLVIYEIYGGGGNAGSTYKNDYVVLHNNSTSAVSIAGWSLQNASTATSSTWKVYPLVGGSIPAGGYYLIKFGTGGGGTTNLPTADFDANTLVGTGGITLSDMNLNATDGKFIISNSTTAETTANPSGANIIDKVGYGNAANGSETIAAPSPSNTNSITRKNNGQDTGNNLNDFTTTPPNPKNSGTSPLPVELTYFQTQTTDSQKVSVKWETAMEINSSYFVLERSRDAVNYKAIANIEAAGSSTSKKTYSFIDESALFGTNYYRLSQIDRDGTQQVFRPQAVVIDDAYMAFGVFPNPSLGTNFNVKVEDSDEANLNLMDFSGRVIELNINKLTQTILEITPTENLKFGTYILKVQTLGSLKKHKILILK
jgi:Lamin Tail Domain/Secretion system C-terminal sorting domain